MKKKRVVVIEDSVVEQAFITYLINADPRLEVIAAFSNAEDAIATINKIAPDVITLDIRLPGMSGLEATHHIMSKKPTPIVVISANVESEELNISMNALRAGALTVVEKPLGFGNKNFESRAQQICDQIALMSEVIVLRQKSFRDLEFTNSDSLNSIPLPNDLNQAARFSALGVVASTGGPSALVTLFQSLPSNFPLPIFLVQHITASFIESFASWLNDLCPFSVQFAKNGETPVKGTIYLPPEDHHLEIIGGIFKISQSAHISQQRPSGTALFNSMADTYGAKAIGVLLTGMGDDGASGLLKIRKTGGFTLAEHESTAVVYGMPGVAVALGGAQEILPLPEIGPRLTSLIASQVESTHGK
jgi:two-component system chemotaxis response regulator CheB